MIGKFEPPYVGCYEPKSFSTFAFTAASILMSGGQGRLKPSPGRFFVASMPSLLPLAISLVAWSSTSDGSLLYQRISHLELRKGRKVAIRRPQLPHAVMEAERGNARVVNARAGNLRGLCNVAQFLEVTGAFGQ